MSGRKWLSLLLLLGLTSSVNSGEPSTGFLNKVFKADQNNSKYVLFVPHDYKGDKEYPLILFLHGAGERGTDGEKQVKQGIGNAIKFKEKEKKFPFIVILPQCSPKGSWTADGADGKRAMAILDETQKTYKVDGKRVYLTGLSLGGYGTWSLAAAHPERWAAIAPICGGKAKDADTMQIAERVKDIPIWCFHGASDKTVPAERSRELIKALQSVGASPRYSEFPHVGHNSWDPAYTTEELYSWLLSHKKK